MYAEKKRNLHRPEKKTQTDNVFSDGVPFLPAPLTAKNKITFRRTVGVLTRKKNVDTFFFFLIFCLTTIC